MAKRRGNICFMPGCRSVIGATRRFCAQHTNPSARLAKKGGRERVCFESGCAAKASDGGYFCADHNRVERASA